MSYSVHAVYIMVSTYMYVISYGNILLHIIEVDIYDTSCVPGSIMYL